LENSSLGGEAATHTLLQSRNLVLGVLLANRFRCISKRGLYKVVYWLAIIKEEIRQFLGLTEEELIREFTKAAKHGPTSDMIGQALDELIHEGVVGLSEIDLPKMNGKKCSLLKDIDPTDLCLPFDISRLTIPSYLPIERLATYVKQDFLNRLTNKQYSWHSPWNLRLAYTSFMMHYTEKLLTKEEGNDLVGFLYRLDQTLEAPSLPWSIQYRADPEIPSPRELTDKLTEILRIESFSGNERAIAENLCQWARSNGLEKSYVDEDNNLFVVLRGRHSAQLMFVFHLDTVAVSFPVEIREGQLYGRGSCDNKAAGVMAIFALIMLARNHIVPSFTIVVTGTSCEEEADRTKRGVLKAIKRYEWSRQDVLLAIVLEASHLNLALGERARWTGEITLRGGGGHVANIYADEIDWVQKRHASKLSAFQRLPDMRALVSRALVEIREIVVKLPEGKFGRTTIVLWESYDQVDRNQTPISGRILFDIRLADIGHKEMIRQQIMNILEKWLPSPFSYSMDWHETCGSITSYLDSKIGHRIRDAVIRLRPFLNAIGARAVSYGFGTDARYLIDEAGIPTVGLGPGDETEAHKSSGYPPAETPDQLKEKISLYQLLKAMLAYFTLCQVCKFDPGWNEPRFQVYPSRSRDMYQNTI